MLLFYSNYNILHCCSEGNVFYIGLMHIVNIMPHYGLFSTSIAVIIFAD